jgi:cytochrome d ubiquinol oxidase subunit I
MVAIGSTLSAFWIIVANSWQQTPAGYIVKNGRAQLTSFSEAVFNPSTWPRFFHTMDAALTTGAFFVAGVAAFLLIRNLKADKAQKALRLALPLGLVFCLLNIVPFGHEHARQVARTQPTKFAAIEGLYISRTAAPLVVFGIPFEKIPMLKAKVEIPALLSWMAFGDVQAKVHGIEEFPPDEVPPLWFSFVSFHNMVALGLLFVAVNAWGTLKLMRHKLWDNRWFLKLLPWMTVLAVAANEFGWAAAEVGRQPWVVYGLLRTSDAVSVTVGPGMILFSMLLLCTLYTALLCVWVYLSHRTIINFGMAAGAGQEE